MVNIPKESLSISSIVVRSEPIARRFVLETAKQDDTFIFRLIYPPEISPQEFRKMVLTFGNTLGEFIPDQFKVKITPITIVPQYKVLQAEVDNFAWYPYAYDIVERAFLKLKSVLADLGSKKLYK